MAKLPALPFIRGAISEGWKAEQTYRQYLQTAREGGFTGTRRQDFLRLYSQTSAIRDSIGHAVTHPRDELPGSNLIKDRDTVHARGYGTWVTIFQRTRGESDLITMPYLIKSNEPITPAEAELRALDYLNQQPDNYNRTTLGVTYTGTERFVPTP